MDIWITLSRFLEEIKSTDLLTYVALVLAYLAYVRSIDRDLESWKSLFISFRSDLNNQEPWFGGVGGYSDETYTDKISFSPAKIIYPLSFESLPEIIRRGPRELPKVSDRFIDRLSLFNERIMAFNSTLDNIKSVVSSDPIMAEKLIDRLNELNIGGTEDKVKFNDFRNKIRELKKREDVFYLAENVRRLNRIVHVEIISNRSKVDKLNYLFHEIKVELEKILHDFDNNKPFYVKYRMELIGVSFWVFLLIEILLG